MHPWWLEITSHSRQRRVKLRVPRGKVKPSPLQGVVSSGRTAAKKDGLCTMDRQSTTTPQVVGSSPAALTRCAPTHQPRIVMTAGKDRQSRSVAQRLERLPYKQCVGCSTQSTPTRRLTFRRIMPYKAGRRLAARTDEQLSECSAVW